MKQLFSDEVLTAYLDGELPSKDRGDLAAALSDDPLLQARLQALDLDIPLVRASFDDVLEHVPAPPAELMITKARLRLTVPVAVMAMAASVLLGVFLGAFLFQSDVGVAGDDWKMAVAKYQVLYVPETLAVPGPSRESQSERLASLSDALGRDLSAATAVSSLEFKRAQMLGFNGEPLVQMAYVSSVGIPYAICVTKVDEANQGPQPATIEGLAASFWVRDGYGYIIIGGQDEGYVTRIASEVSQQI